MLLTVQFVASAVEWFRSIHIFALFVILNGSEMSQSSHESSEVYLVLSIWKQNRTPCQSRWALKLRGADVEKPQQVKVFPAKSDD